MRAPRRYLERLYACEKFPEKSSSTQELFHFLKLYLALRARRTCSAKTAPQVLLEFLLRMVLGGQGVTGVIFNPMHVDRRLFMFGKRGKADERFSTWSCILKSREAHNLTGRGMTLLTLMTTINL